MVSISCGHLGIFMPNKKYSNFFSSNLYNFLLKTRVRYFLYLPDQLIVFYKILWKKLNKAKHIPLLKWPVLKTPNNEVLTIISKVYHLKGGVEVFSYFSLIFSYFIFLSKLSLIETLYVWKSTVKLYIFIDNGCELMLM